MCLFAPVLMAASWEGLDFPSIIRYNRIYFAGYTAQVWCNGNTSASQADNAGSIPVTCSTRQGPGANSRSRLFLMSKANARVRGGSKVGRFAARQGPGANSRSRLFLIVQSKCPRPGWFQAGQAFIFFMRKIYRRLWRQPAV